MPQIHNPRQGINYKVEGLLVSNKTHEVYVARSKKFQRLWIVHLLKQLDGKQIYNVPTMQVKDIKLKSHKVGTVKDVSIDWGSRKIK